MLFRKLFRLKPHPNAKTPHAARGIGIQMRLKAKEQYFDYELIDSNQDWKSKCFYIENQLPSLPKVTMHTPEHHARWIDEPNMHECLQVPDLLKKITELK